MTKYRNPKVPDVRAGGVAIPLGNNFFYMKGRKHSAGGIDVGDDLEVEDGEVMQLDSNGSGARVYSSVPFLRGSSPAELLLGGANPNDVFKAQENFKDVNRIKDDGTKYPDGGEIKRDAIVDYRPNDAEVNVPKYIQEREFNRYVTNRNKTLQAIKGVAQVFDPSGIISGIDALVAYANGDYRGAAISAVQAIPLAGKLAFLSNVGKGVRLSNNARKVNRYYNRNKFHEYVNDGLTAAEQDLRYLSRQGNVDDFALDNIADRIKVINQTNNGTKNAIDYINKIENIQTGSRALLESDDVMQIVDDKNNNTNKKQFGGNMPAFSINGNIRDGLIFVPSSTGRKTNRKKAPLGSRLIGLDRTLRMLQLNDGIQKEHTPVVIQSNDNENDNDNTNNNNSQNIENSINTGIGITVPTIVGGGALATYLAQNPKARQVIVQRADAIKQNVARNFGNLAESFIGNEFGVIDEKELRRYTSKHQPDRRRTSRYSRSGGVRPHNNGTYFDYEMYKDRMNFDERNTGNMYGDTHAGNTRVRERHNNATIRGGAPVSEIERNRFNRQYDRATGKREPASGFGRRPVTTELYMDNPPRLNLDEHLDIAGQQYDATVEANRSAAEFAESERQNSNQSSNNSNAGRRNNVRRGAKPRKITLASRMSNGVKNIGKGLGIVGNLNIIGDLIRSWFATEEDDRQQRVDAYYRTGDIRYLKDLSDIYSEMKQPMKYGGRKKAEGGTQTNNVVGVPLFSLFGPAHDRVLQIGYGNNGGVNFYDGAMADLNNPNLTPTELINNGYYYKPIDWFNRRRFDYPIVPANYAPQSTQAPVTPVTPVTPTSSAPRRGSTQARPSTPTTNQPTNVTPSNVGTKVRTGEEVLRDMLPIPQLNNTIQKPLFFPKKKNTDDGRYKGEFDAITPNDWWSLGANIAGSFGSWLAGLGSPRMRVTLPDRPIFESPVRMRTSYNNRPEVSRITEETRRAMRDVRANTASSRAALQRLQRLHNARVQGINESEANKYNIETQLRNADAANRQGVRTRNVNTMNRYLTNRAETINRQNFADYQYRLDRVNRNIGLLNNVNVSFQDFLDRINRRENYNNTLGYLFASHPNVDDRAFRDALVRYAELVKVNG